MRILLVLSAFLVFVKERSGPLHYISTISKFFTGTAKFSIQINFDNFMKLTDDQVELFKNCITFKI